MCDYTGSHFGASYPDACCIDGFLWNLDSCDEPGGALRSGGDLPCPACKTEEFLADARKLTGDGSYGFVNGEFWCAAYVWRGAMDVALKANAVKAMAALREIGPVTSKEYRYPPDHPEFDEDDLVQVVIVPPSDAPVPADASIGPNAREIVAEAAALMQAAAVYLDGVEAADGRVPVAGGTLAKIVKTIAVIGTKLDELAEHGHLENAAESHEEMKESIVTLPVSVSAKSDIVTIAVDCGDAYAAQVLCDEIVESLRLGEGFTVKATANDVNG